MSTSRFPSAFMLASRIRRWFKGRPGSGPCWIVDSSLGFCAPPSWSESEDEIIELVLMGNFFHELLQLRFWPERRFRVWVLCEASRQTVIRVLRLPADGVGVIPRYELFRLIRPRLLPDPASVFSFVYSGRLSRAKNVLLLLGLVSELQVRHGWRAGLVFFGDFDGYGVEDAGLGEMSRLVFEREFRRELALLSWTARPRVVEGLGSGEWLRRLPCRSVGVSLSRHIKEDFGVGLAQLQARGVPIVASAWGAHWDLRHCMLIPFTRVSHPVCGTRERRHTARRAADFLANHWPLARRFESEQAAACAALAKTLLNDHMPHRALSKADLIMSSQRFAPRFPGATRLTSQDHWIEYCASREGRRLMRAYRGTFSRPLMGGSSKDLRGSKSKQAPESRFLRGAPTQT